MNAPTNGNTPPNLADRHAARHFATAPQGRATLPFFSRLRVLVAIGAVGLFVGGLIGNYTSVGTNLQPTPIEHVFADVNGDGVPDLIVSGWVVFAPKAPGQ